MAIKDFLGGRVSAQSQVGMEPVEETGAEAREQKKAKTLGQGSHPPIFGKNNNIPVPGEK